ncbi:hypothetical protein NHF48_007365 [Sphingomonas sp. H160509]|uniref:hypothetical protein n=1 Tax=Sphingomonas sp. H160509 TaxID=2955313 RepID=UPI002096FBAF|nr:hypothetical protein [Sphingomonas sp. H160509]MDD1450820.1 hypothetical protein [Sphingomonas sp. H160509]
MILLLTGGAGAGAQPAVVEYTAGRVATLADTFTPPLDATTQVSMPANWWAMLRRRQATRPRA